MIARRVLLTAVLAYLAESFSLNVNNQLPQTDKFRQKLEKLVKNEQTLFDFLAKFEKTHPRQHSSTGFRRTEFLDTFSADQIPPSDFDRKMKIPAERFENFVDLVSDGSFIISSSRPEPELKRNKNTGEKIDTPKKSNYNILIKFSQ